MGIPDAAAKLTRVSATYPKQSRRTALVPALLAVVALLIGVALINSDGFIVIRFIVSIFALIVSVFAWQARQWWWVVPLAVVAVLWNPVLAIDLAQPDLWLGLQYVAAIVFIAAGILIRVSDSDKPTARR